MGSLGLILMCFAFVCACLAVWPWPAPPRWNLIAASLAFFYAAVIFGNAGALFHFR